MDESRDALDSSGRLGEPAPDGGSTAHLRRLVDLLPFGAAYADGERLLVNPAVEAITGYAREELATVDAWFHTLFGSDAEAIRRVYEADRALGFPERRVVDFHRKDGARRTAEFQAREEGTVVVWVLHDVTDREAATAALGESQRSLATLLANLPGMAYRGRDDEHWTMEVVSEGCRALTGYSPEELVGNRRRSYESIIHPDDRGRVRDEVHAALATGRAFHLTYRIATADGVEKWVSENGQGVRGPQGQLLAIEGFIQDVTAQVHSVAQLRRHEALLEESQRLANVGSWEWTPATDEVTWSAELYRIFGLEPDREPLTGRHFFDAIHPDDRARVKALIDESLRTGDPISYSHRIVRPDGTVRVLYGRGSVVRDKNGAVTGMTGIGQDITERAAAEERLAESEARFRSLVEASAQIVWRVSPAGWHLDQLASFFASTGIEVGGPGQFGWSWLDAVHPDDRDATRQTWEQAFATGTPYEITHRLKRRDGEWRVMHARAVPVRNTDGTIREWVGTHTDVTERVRATEALRFLAGASDVLSATLDLDRLLETLVRLGLPRFGDGCVIDLVFNGTPERHFLASNLSPEREARARAFVDLLGPATKGAPARAVLETGRPLLVPEVTEAFLVAAGFTTERVAELQALGLRSLLLVPMVARGSALGLLTFFVSESDRRLTPADRDLAEELAGRAALAIENARLFAAARAELEERREAENALRVSEALLRGFFDVPDVYMSVHDVDDATDDFIVVLANRPAAARFSCTPETIRGRRGRELGVTEAVITDWVSVFRQCQRTGEPYSFEFESTLPGSAGTYAATVSRIDRGAERPLVAYVATDITKQKQLEAQFRQAQKMEAVGQLAGGVAHDFNNLLTVITSYADLLHGGLAPADPRIADVGEIRAAADRAAQLTRQLLAFSRQQVLRPAPLNVSRVIGGIEGMLRRLLGEDVTLTTCLAANPPAVLVDQVQLEQVVLNLAVNARDAMPEGGTLVIETVVEDRLPAGASRPPSGEPSAWVALRVRDTGSGMDEATKARVFEPFFTTKPVGKGTGLGLPTVYGIVQQSGGTIEVESTPGAGTTFTVLLPALPGDAPGKAVEPVTPALTLATRVGTVLLAEDDSAIRRAASRILAARGYTVLEAADAEEALAAAERHAVAGGALDLVLTDVVMPGMRGSTLARRLQDRYPTIGVLLMSGYAQEVAVGWEGLPPGAGFLQKPFTVDALTRAVEEVLAGRRAAAVRSGRR